MLLGKVTVFLSCSEKFKERVARPIRDGLTEYGIRGIIVSDEPLPVRADDDPNSKVDAYLDASDALVALCTPDNELTDGTIECRQNIIEEYRRAKERPSLRHRTLVFKERSVTLPSNINPTTERLDVDDVSGAPELIVRQLVAWSVFEGEPPRVSAQAGEADSATSVWVEPSDVVLSLIGGFELGDQEEATRLAYNLLRAESRIDQQLAVKELQRFLDDPATDGAENVYLVTAVLEAISRLDPRLVPVDVMADLASSNDIAKRMSAAMLLWDRAEIAPGEVPLGLLGKLARPAEEDWYVQAPAMAATKQLLLRRRSARIIFDELAKSADTEDRHAVATALLDVAGVDATVAPRDLVERLARDADELVASKGREVLDVLGESQEGARDPLSPFGL